MKNKNPFSIQMEKQSDEWLQMCINNQHQFVPDAIQAAKWEIEKREEIEKRAKKKSQQKIPTNEIENQAEKSSIGESAEEESKISEYDDAFDSFVPFLNSSPHLKEMVSARNNIHSIITENDRPKWYTASYDYIGKIGYATKLLFVEKQLIVLALLQWVFVALGYYLWVQVFDWIPEQVWELALNSQVPLLVDIFFLFWSILIVGIVAFPIGILTACMGAVHFLHQQKSKANLATCLKVVLPNSWSIWIFSWIDSWWTVYQIFYRLPSKDGSNFSIKKEMVYLAWKLGTMGMIPAMVTGKKLTDAGKDSINFISTKLKKACIVRLGYSTICWVIGILSYIGTLIYMFTEPGTLDFTKNISSQMYVFFFWVGVPIMISTGIVLVFLRPVYIITSCDLYSQYVTKTGNVPLLNEKAGKGLSSLVAFTTLMLFVLVIWLFRDEIGVSRILSLQ